jgi:hypothetical protein
MRGLNQVFQDMQARFPLLDFQITASYSGPSFSWVHVRDPNNNVKFMRIEVDINYDQESVIASIIENNGFMRKEFTLIMDSFLNSFD